MNAQNLSNEKLLDELGRRLDRNFTTGTRETLARLEEEIRQLGIRLQESENSKSQFLSNVRNEINNPLSAILGLAACIRTSSTEEKIRQLSMLIEKQAAELDFQMRNIIMAAEIEAGELRKSCARVDVVSLVEDQLSYLRHRIEQRGARVELRVPVERMFCTDPGLLQSICVNLFANAIEYCGSNKVVMIDVSFAATRLQLSVRDLGGGIAPALQSEIFLRFRQGETGLLRKHGGHGLGLCIVKELTDHLEGTIQVQSFPGQGTVVNVTIPQMADNVPAIGSSFGNEFMFAESEIV